MNRFDRLFWRRLWKLAKPYWVSEQKWVALELAGRHAAVEWRGQKRQRGVQLRQSGHDDGVNQQERASLLPLRAAHLALQCRGGADHRGGRIRGRQTDDPLAPMADRTVLVPQLPLTAPFIGS